MKVKKSRSMLAFCFLAVSLGTFVAAHSAKNNFSVAHSTLIAQQGHAYDIPEAPLYSIFFHYVVDVKKHADELKLSGKDDSFMRSYFQREARLDDRQARALDDISSEVLREVEQQDRKALAVIERFSTQFPGGKVPKGMTLPPPPPELQVMQQERDAMLLKGRDRLRAILGEGGFKNLENFIIVNIKPKIKITQAHKK
jgi:hypothetical protein